MDNRIEVSNELKQLYKLLKSFEYDNKADYHYLRFIVRNGGRDYMFLLLKQLEEMTKEYNLEE